ncbi:hypothetical protein MKW98_027515 [Papaver atlanticum]|uniref:Uncharacterized protein n=1 Tax=Papaver atlanticum TaxID=357466 RepID=A0AAD4X4L6_9MAGN|nr:hypothetical protein MKW98_027515 [Papaver atlanticum]
MQLKHGIQLGKDLELYRIKCHGLSTELKEKEMEYVGFEGKLKNLMSVKVALDEELEEHKSACTGMQLKITALAKEQKVLSNRKKRVLERTSPLEEAAKKFENDERETFVQLKTENRDLECWKRRAEDEIESWKKRCTELEAQVLRVEGEVSTLRTLQNEVSYNNIANKCINEDTCKMDASDVSHLNLKDEMLSKTGSTPSSNNKENFTDLHVSGPLYCTIFKDKRKNISSDLKVEFTTAAREQLCFKTEGSSRKKLDLIKQSTVPTSSRGIVEINDSEDEKEITEEHTCNVTDEKIDYVSIDGTVKRCISNGKNLASKNYSQRSLSDQRVGECERSFDEDITLAPLSSTTKRCRTIKGEISRTECQDDDTIPFGKLLNLCDGGQTVGKLESSSRRSFPLKKNNMLKRTSGNESATMNDL